MDGDVGGDALLPVVAIDEAGNATVAWTAVEGTDGTIWARRYSATEGSWGPAEPLSAEGQDGSDVSVEIDGEGNVLALWTQKDKAMAPPRLRKPYLRWYDSTEGKWLPAVTPEIEAEADSWLGEIAVRPNGEAMLVWERDGDALMVSRLR